MNNSVFSSLNGLTKIREKKRKDQVSLFSYLFVSPFELEEKVHELVLKDWSNRKISTPMTRTTFFFSLLSTRKTDNENLLRLSCRWSDAKRFILDFQVYSMFNEDEKVFREQSISFSNQELILFYVETSFEIRQQIFLFVQDSYRLHRWEAKIRFVNSFHEMKIFIMSQQTFSFDLIK